MGRPLFSISLERMPKCNFICGEAFYPESMSGWCSPPLKGRGRGGVCNFFSVSFIVCSSRWKKLETPPLPRLRPTVASLPNCSGPRRFAPQSLPPRDCLAIALKGGEWLPPEKSQVVPYTRREYSRVELLPPEKSQSVPYPRREYSRGELLPPESMAIYLGCDVSISISFSGDLSQDSLHRREHLLITESE